MADTRLHGTEEALTSVMQFRNLVYKAIAQARVCNRRSLTKEQKEAIDQARVALEAIAEGHLLVLQNQLVTSRDELRRKLG